jgi:hypothetical protein
VGDDMETEIGREKVRFMYCSYSTVEHDRERERERDREREMKKQGPGCKK